MPNVYDHICEKNIMFTIYEMFSCNVVRPTIQRRQQRESWNGLLIVASCSVLQTNRQGLGPTAKCAYSLHSLKYTAAILVLSDSFYRATQQCSRGLGSRNFVRPSVCLSLTLMLCDETKKRICRYFDTTWKGNYCSLLNTDRVGGKLPFPPEMCA